jgi:N-acylneuraminate cytidylyltransferase
MTTLAVIPARGGSKGLARKNVLPLAGLPLIGHAIRLAQLCPELDETVVSTEDAEVAGTARSLGAQVLERPVALAGDDTAMWPVLQHALAALDPAGDRFDLLVLLEPTNPLRRPTEVAGAIATLRARPDADGVVTVSEPSFSPIWQCVVEQDGVLEHLVQEGRRFERRQDVPRVLYINGCVYVWRASFVRSEPSHWLNGRTVGYETPEQTAVSIDSPEDFERCRLLIDSGTVTLPWVTGASGRRT